MKKVVVSVLVLVVLSLMLFIQEEPESNFSLSFSKQCSESAIINYGLSFNPTWNPWKIILDKLGIKNLFDKFTFLKKHNVKKKEKNEMGIETNHVLLAKYINV